MRSNDSHVYHPCWLDDENVAYLLGDMVAQATNVRVWNTVTGATRLLTQFAGKARWLAIHPSKRKIAVVQVAEDGSQKIIVRDLETKADQLIVENGVYECLRWSPDGLSLSWSGEIRSSDQISNGVWTIKLGESQARQIAKDGYGPVWSADGSGMYYSKTRNETGLWLFDVKRQKETKVRNWKGAFFDFAGERLIFTQGSGQHQIYSLALIP
jgi:Tol biopolymer transport system component